MEEEGEEKEEEEEESVLTVVGYIISDILYMLFDPRIRNQRELA